MAGGLALVAVTQRADASVGMVALWAVGLLIAGIGIGMTWPHLSMRAMDSVDDPAESGAAGGGDQHRPADLRGVRGRVGGRWWSTRPRGGDLPEARWLYAVFAVAGRRPAYSRLIAPGGGDKKPS